ncbi:MAG: rhombotarget lipoprotein [Mariprofundaceae bacterium]|nr:rhombotarget lipoprotein [Mariprofundaceae bacterium]
MIPSKKKITVITLMLTFCIFLTSCSIMREQHHSSSVVQYLYPDQKDQIITPSIPRLTLPLKVGVAFVPENTLRSQALTEIDKMKLMKEVSNHFKQNDFVKSIELIPSSYLQNKGSFTNLDQIRTMYGVDIITLLSYDQTRFTDEGFASFTYWTIIGAYIIPGEKNDTHTMVDATVYDIQSRKMLFRAPGVSHIKSNATPINLSEQLREDSVKSFDLASKDLIRNLDIQLELFKDKIKESPEEYQIIRTQGYTGGGSLDTSFLALFLLLTILGLRNKKEKSA